MDTEESLDVLNRVGRALADPPARGSCWDGPGAPRRPCRAVGLVAGELSNNLACLGGCDLVAATGAGRCVSYELADPALARTLRDLVGLVLSWTQRPRPPSGPQAVMWVMATLVVVRRGHRAGLHRAAAARMIAAAMSLFSASVIANALRLRRAKV